MLNKQAYSLVDFFVKHGLNVTDTLHVFDLDDTLLCTKELIIEAYIAAGMTRETVLENWGRSAEEWVPENVRKLKKKAYSKILTKAKPEATILYHAARSGLLGSGVMTLTGASLDSYNLLHKTMGYLPNNLGTSIRRGGKAEIITQVA